jgi:hypothetical protein
MEAPQPQNEFSNVRCPQIEGLAPEIVHMLHKSFVGIILMRKSIESAQMRIDASREAANEALKLLDRLKAEGF